MRASLSASPTCLMRLLPVLVGLMEWGDEFLSNGDPPVVLEERDSGEQVRLELRSTSGALVAPHQIVTRARRRRVD